MSAAIKPYQVELPSIPSGDIYYFTTDKQVRYEVRFGRRQHDQLHATIVFGVLNEEYEGEEYAVTNKGDTYRVMATVAAIVRTYIDLHPGIHTYEFCGEPHRVQTDAEPTTRTRFYMRYIDQIFGPGWQVRTEGNRVFISRFPKRS